MDEIELKLPGCIMLNHIKGISSESSYIKR